MASTTSLIQSLSEALGVPRETVDWAARQLREAGLFPVGKGGRGGAGAAEVTAAHAVSLLLALLAGEPPTKATKFVPRYLALPARRAVYDQEISGSVMSRMLPIEDVPIADGAGADWVRATRSLGCALEKVLLCEGDNFIVPGETVTLTLSRNPSWPVAILQFIPPVDGNSQAADDRRGGALIYAEHEDMGRRQGLAVDATAPPCVFTTLRALLGTGDEVWRPPPSSRLPQPLPASQEVLR